ncbi:MAG TPA: hypothetical protein VKU40_00140, partial [Thermoanaerobaculia bacterium]|nr:hypothetical protein [Thermoanaerobaculia bacterium]
MFRIEMLPAAHGDALLIEYGDQAAPRRVLVDGGPWYAYDEVRARLFEIFGGSRIDLELLVVTHVD